MYKWKLLLIGGILVVLSILVWFLLANPGNSENGPTMIKGELIALPLPTLDGGMSVEKALVERRSRRTYSDDPLTLDELSQLLWAAQGVTDPRGYRTSPSAGALYPLEVYLLVGKVHDLPAGIYKYGPQVHGLVRLLEGDRRLALYEVALKQEAINEAAAVIILAAVYERTTKKYGQRGERYVHMEVGSVAQNVYLQAEALGVGTVFIGAFYDEEVKELLDMPAEEQPLGIMPLGNP